MSENIVRVYLHGGKELVLVDTTAADLLANPVELPAGRDGSFKKMIAYVTGRDAKGKDCVIAVSAIAAAVDDDAAGI